MINGAYARPIVLRSLGGTQLMCPHTHKHMWCGRRWFSISPPHSGDLEEHTEREKSTLHAAATPLPHVLQYITCSPAWQFA